MAVDVKSLRIGSHILVNGKRERVRGLDEDNGLIVRFPAEYVNANGVEPIPITPELLKELGFEERRMEYRYGKPDVWYIDSESAQIEKGNNLVVPTIHVSSLGKAGYSDWWEIKVVTGDKPMRAGNCTVRYLHEAESFLAFHNIELIK